MARSASLPADRADTHRSGCSRRVARNGPKGKEGGGDMNFDNLSTILWRERELLELLLFKAEEKQYVIVSGKTQWLPRIAREIELVLSHLRTLEVERAAQTEEIAADLGLDANPSLRQVAMAAPAPWDDLLQQHYESLLVVVSEIRVLSDANRDLAETGLNAINDAMAHAQAPSAGTYTATGRQSTPAHRAVTLDGTL